MLTLLFIGMLTLAFNIQLVRIETTQEGEVETTILPSTLDESELREEPKYPSLVELSDETGESSSSWVPFENSLSPCIRARTYP